MYTEQSNTRETKTSNTSFAEALAIAESEKEFGGFIQSLFDGSYASEVNEIDCLNIGYSTTLRKQDSTSSIPSVSCNDRDTLEEFSHDLAPSTKNSIGSAATIGRIKKRNSWAFPNRGIHKSPFLSHSRKSVSFSSPVSSSINSSRSISPSYVSNLQVSPPPYGMPLLNGTETELIAGFLDVETTNDCISPLHLSDLPSTERSGSTGIQIKITPPPMGCGSSYNQPIFETLSGVSFVSTSNNENSIDKNLAAGTPSLFVNDWSHQPPNVPRSLRPEAQGSYSFDGIPASMPFVDVQDPTCNPSTNSKIVSPLPINKCAFQPSSSRSNSSESVLPRSKILKFASGSRRSNSQKNPPIYTCPICNKKLTRRSNLHSHMEIHSGIKPFNCQYCHRGFLRKNDCARHENLHTKEKQYICRGYLKDGSEWGCGRSYLRAESLRRHFETAMGRECKRPLLEEENGNHDRGVEEDES
ncbi:uncharacterized protein J8A68_001734 [[Candida] subhashii]|uniref:C2H2-type domain-containing protein n=1 Tax=[Candida] subhashii TaxID=561895 RepID=A0A8J5QF96_9ASCO|nr:uncharacterized protein J8A68_001734 [[Candida] subhashii]KAG7664709.1 hypothetical protein J8A68_001734 [[Candida] subhashii]